MHPRWAEKAFPSLVNYAVGRGLAPAVEEFLHPSDCHSETCFLRFLTKNLYTKAYYCHSEPFFLGGLMKNLFA